MSRPFSYNDKNFTVIGNVLFCHIKLSHYISSYVNIIEVPPAIYERLMFYDNQLFAVGNNGEPITGSIMSIIVSDNGKYYLRSKNGFSSPPYKYLIGFYFLKDI